MRILNTDKTGGSAGGKEQTPKHVKVLIASLKDSGSPHARVKAACALGERGNKAVVPALIDALKDRDVRVRKAAAEALANIGEEASSAVPALIDALKDRKSYFNWSATFALSKIGKKAVPALIASLKDPDALVRQVATFGLAGIEADIGEEASGAIPTLIANLSDPNGQTAQGAVRALYKIGEKAMQSLIVSLKDSGSPSDRCKAAWALGEMRKKGRDAVPALEEAAVNDPDRDVRFQAKYSLDTIHEALKYA